MVGFVFLTHGKISSGERDHSVNCLLHKMGDLSLIHSTRVKSQTDLGPQHGSDVGSQCATRLMIYLNSIPGSQMVKGKKRVPKGFFCICAHSINKCN